ncbi:hypothetical protein [Flavihumibacter petaseus]|uniref:hypothetical protein n=1 Tax=Flavihumibacter petaseus TaxID=549295 RepID=UPI00061D3584|nr:hypothetical protein [Flavihumibacter petaseus]
MENKGAFTWLSGREQHEITLPDSLAKYIARGHEAIDTVTGDINEDNINDLVLVTGLINEDSLRYESGPINLPRHMLIFMGYKNNQYHFSFRNKKAIPCITCCGMSDPYCGMTVHKGWIVLQTYCGSNCKSLSEHRFRYYPKAKDWLLDSVISESYCFYYEQYELDTLTRKDFGKVSLKTFVLYEDEE